jgi:ComF family protein
MPVGVAPQAPHRARAALLLQPFRRLVDSMLPPRCINCRALVHREAALCADCWPLFDFLTAPVCLCCGFPFEYDPGPGDTMCAACTARRPLFERARAVLVYGEPSRRLVLDFKHGDRTWPAPAFGRWLARAGAALVAGADLAVPVPLHRSRLYARRYNQAAMMALALGRETGLAVQPDLLVRRRPTPSQGRMSPSARRRNVRGAFAVRPGYVAPIAARRILLIDDVLTTGATAEECARTLLGAGADAVDVLTLARVVRPRVESR